MPWVSGCCLYKFDLLDLDLAVHQLVYVHSRLGARRRTRSECRYTSRTARHTDARLGPARTLPASMSISTKLGRVLFVTLLNAPVADPGFMRKRSSSFDAWARASGAQRGCSRLSPAATRSWR